MTAAPVPKRTERFLFDTDVLVDYLRDASDAVAFVEERTRGAMTSALVIAELFAGVRDGIERIGLETLVGALDVVPVDAAVAEYGGLARREYGRSHGTGLVDALIAGTVKVTGATLVTLNAKPFAMLPRWQVLVPYRK